MALLALLLAGLSLYAFTPDVPWFIPPAKSKDPQYDSATWEKIQTLKINANWENVPIKTAWQQLTSLSKQADPAHVGIKFTYMLPEMNRTVNMILAGAKLDDVMTSLSVQSNAHVKIHKGEVLILPRKSA